jgi:hypothetical protein
MTGIMKDRGFPKTLRASGPVTAQQAAGAQPIGFGTVLIIGIIFALLYFDCNSLSRIPPIIITKRAPRILREPFDIVSFMNEEFSSGALK